MIYFFSSLKKKVNKEIRKAYIKKSIFFLLNYNLFTNLIISKLLWLFRGLFYKKGFYFKIKISLVTYLNYLYIKKYLNKTNLILLNYNFKLYPKSYGEFFVFLMLCKYFNLKNKNVIIVIPEFDKHIKFIDEFNPFIKKNLPKSKIINNFQNESYYNYEILRIPKLNLNNTIRGHHLHLNLINKLLNNETNSFLNKFLIKKNDLCSNNQKMDKEYIAIHFRYTSPNSDLYKSEIKRNTNKYQFIKTINLIQNIFPKNNLIILSSKKGNDYFQKIADKFNIKCNFSTANEKSYFNDLNIVVNSRFYFQLNGGGLCVGAWFSKINYLIFVKDMPSEIRWSFNKFNPWSTNSQITRQISTNEEFYAFIRLMHCKLKLN